MGNLNKSKKYHFIYKTTNLLNNKFYIGMHSTSNLTDGYLGSGKRLRYSIRKYGKENFKCEILEFLPDRESLVKREIEIVNSELLKEEKCLNLKTGGSGGFSNEEHKRKFVKAGSDVGVLKLKEMFKDPEYGKYRGNKYRESYKNLPDEIKERMKVYGFKGKKHTDVSKKKISEKAKLLVGEKNSQFGSRWITNGVENKKIKKDYEIPKGWYLGRKI